MQGHWSCIRFVRTLENLILLNYLYPALYRCEIKIIFTHLNPSSSGSSSSSQIWSVTRNERLCFVQHQYLCSSGFLTCCSLSRSQAISLHLCVLTYSPGLILMLGKVREPNPKYIWSGLQNNRCC